MPETPSIVELLERLVALESAVVALERVVAARDARIEVLEGENAELRRRLGQTPRNSNMPPSAQGLDKPVPKSLRGRSGRRAGGQDGHQGRTLRQVDVPDETVRHEPAVCAGCGDGLADAEVVAVIRRQVFEIPQVKARVVEHHLVSRRCRCAAVTCGSVPAGVDAPVQYGPRLSAVVVYLLVAQSLPWIIEAKGGRRLGLPRLREGATQLCRPGLMTGPHVKVLCGTSLTDRLFMTIDVEDHDPVMSPWPEQAEAAETDRILALAQSRMLTYFSLRALPADSLRILPIGPGVESRRSRRGGAATVTLLEDDESTQVERQAARQDPSYLQRPGEHRLDMLTGAVPGTDLILGMSRRLYAACEELARQQEQIAVMVDQEIPRPGRDEADEVADRINAARRRLLYQEVDRSEARDRTREAFESAQDRHWWSLIDRPARLTPEPEQNVLEAATEDTYLAVDARTAELAIRR